MAAMAQAEGRGMAKSGGGGLRGGGVHKRQVLCVLSIFGCAPEQVVVVLAASMLTQCSAHGPRSSIVSAAHSVATL